MGLSKHGTEAAQPALAYWSLTEKKKDGKGEKLGEGVGGGVVGEADKMH